MPLKRGIASIVTFEVLSLQAEVGNYELFDVPELQGTAFTGYTPLISVSAITDDAYFQEDVNPLLYRNYPIEQEIFITHRNPDDLGLVPTKAMTLMSDYLASITSKQPLPSELAVRLPYVYDLPLVYREDLDDIQYQVVNKYLDTPLQSKYLYMINGYYPLIRNGKYKVAYQYMLPGGIKGTSVTYEYSKTY
jgi:hypothetical protein